MLSIFKNLKRTQRTFAFPNLNYIRSGLQKNLERIQQHNRDNYKASEDLSILLTLIYSLRTGNYVNSNNLYVRYSEDDISLAIGAGIVNPVTPIAKAPVSLLGENIETIFLLNHHGLSPGLIDGNFKDWRTAEPLKFLYNPMSDLNFNIPDGSTTSTAEGVAVISIDIAMLGMQLNEWIKENTKRPEGERHSPSRFLMDYPLNNLLKSQLDCILFNRHFNAFNGLSNSVTTKKLDITLVDYSEKLEEEFKEIAESMKKQELPVADALATLPLSLDTNLLDIIPKFDGVPTRAVYWCLILAYLPYLEFSLFNLIGIDTKKNKDFIHSIKKELRVIRNNGMWQEAPNKLLESFIKDSAEAIRILL